MLDTNVRKYVQPAIRRFAEVMIKFNLTADHVTIMAFVIGMSASVFIYFDMILVGLCVLWFSGLLDAVDGSIARITRTSSSWGALMDLIFDRFVEMGLIVALSLKNEQSSIFFILLLCSILFSMCVFLSVGALSANTGEKAFKYQAGVMERTEGFFAFSIMAIFQNHINYIVVITAILIFFTALQRMREARQIFKKTEGRK